MAGNYTDLAGLQNIDPINLSFANFTNPSTVITQIQTTANNEVGNYWFIGGIIVLFLMFVWWFYRQDQNFALDMTRSILIASSWCLFITSAFLLSGWITTVVPLIWFTTSFILSLVGAYKLKGKGL